ncbi:hypothetical protein VNO77_10451 [Canavalia gladiata]|uniref:MBD domain-containing protein n=1 Tax=Canavalia gladiata TaxID=3824 RepID=A0AAN9QXU4_CANGL
MPMATPEPSTDHIDSLPLIDLRLLSQSELYSLSLSGATPRHRTEDDSVIPKIDRSVFNESAGSRKQTFSRLRLNKQNSMVSASSFHIPLRIPEPVDEENFQIIALLQQLFGVESIRNAHPRSSDDADDCRLVPVQVEFKQPPLESPVFQNIPIDVIDGSQRKRKRGRPRKNENVATGFEEEEPGRVTGNGFGTSLEKKEEEPRRVDRNGEGNVVAMINEKGFVIDAVRLADSVDPFGEELKRRTQGLETESQLLEFLESLNGEWGSQRKKRRIVQASDLGDLLPMGWKIVLCLLRRAGRASVVCRRYVSPDGHQFESCKEVSAHLLSFYGVQASHLKPSYPDASQQLFSSINMASESSVGHVPAGDIKTNANASYFSQSVASIHSNHEKEGIISIGSENLANHLALGCVLGDTTGGAFRGFDHQTEDKQPLKDDKNDGNSVDRCSLGEDRVCNVRSEKLVGAVEASDSTCNLYIPLVFSTPFSNNNNNGQFSDEINGVTCIKGGLSNFANQDRSTGCYETVACGNEQAHVDNNDLELSVKLVEENNQKIGFESSMLAPNSEGKIFTGKNLEDRHFISALEDMGIRDGKPIKDDKQQIICNHNQPEIEDVSINVKLQSSSEGCSHVPFQSELEHTSNNNMDRTLTSMQKDSAEEIFFDSDLFSLSIDERTCVHSNYISNVSFSSCTLDASESGGVDFASDLKVTEDVSDNHLPPNEEAVASDLQERSSLKDQNCTMDDLLHRSSESNLFALTSNQHATVFHDNVNNISSGTFGALKAVDAGCMKPQFVPSSDFVAEDTYTTTSIMQGKSQGCVSVPLGGSILNQFDKQSNDGVNKANKSCLPEDAKNEVEVFQTDYMGLPKFR